MLCRGQRAFIGEVDPKATRKFNFEPSVMFIDLADREAELCSQIFHGLTVLKVGHARAATERMLVTRPRVIVFSTKMPPSDVTMLTERAQDVGAWLVQISEGISQSDLAPRLLAALRAAEG